MGDILRLKLSKDRDVAGIDKARRGTLVISRTTAIIGVIAGILGAVNYLLPSLLKSPPGAGGHSVTAKPDTPPSPPSPPSH